MANTTQDYWNTIKSIATDARAEYPNPDDDARGVYCDDDDRSEYIWETVDGSEWITYSSNNVTVLDATNNENAIDDVGLEATTNWEKLLMTCAFYAMLQDVNDELLAGVKA